MGEIGKLKSELNKILNEYGATAAKGKGVLQPDLQERGEIRRRTVGGYSFDFEEREFVEDPEKPFGSRAFV
jgi:hypothetical protein